MNNSKEIQCAQLAWAAQVRMHERILGESYSQQFDSPLSGVSLLPEHYRGIKQLLLLPIAWVMVLFLAVLLPFAYVAHRIELHKTRTALRQKIRMPFNAAVYETPTVKTIGALWDACDLPNRVGLQESTKLVDDWLAILYGSDMANSVNAEARARVIVKKQAEANRPYHEGQEGAPHFHFPLPIESLIRELTEELPPYY